MRALELFRKASQRLRAAGGDPREAELLLYAATGVGREALYRDDPPVPADRAARLDDYVSRRISNEPLAYISGSVRFLELDITVSPKVLIPRPETEWMVARIIDTYNARNAAPRRILDIGVGSGCIALALARAFPEGAVFGTDISLGALEVATSNARRNRMEGRVAFVVDRSLAAFARTGRFDLVVSNPPYVADRERTTLQKDVIDFEPPEALFGGDRGLDFYRRTLPRLPDVLAPGARAVLEIGADQGNSILALMEQNLFRDVEVWRDVAGRERVVTGIVRKT